MTFDPPENVGGVEGRARNYTEILSLKGFFVEVMSLSPGYRYFKSRAYGAPLLRLPSSISSLPYVVREILREIRRNKIDCIFFLSGGTSLIGNVLMCYSRLKRITTSVFVYGKDLLTARGSVSSVSTAILGLSLANGIVANSHYTANLLPEALRKRKTISILYPAVDPGALRHSDTPAEEAPRRRRVLFVGRLVKRKGVDLLLLAFKRCLNSFPDLRLVIVGDGPELENLVDKARRLGLDDDVATFRGKLTGRELYVEYSRCDVFVMASTTTERDVEGFGTVFLEAGLFAKPCVGSYSGGIPEAILDGKTGILVPEGDAEALYEAIVRILNDPTFAKMLGENGRTRVMDAFTWETSTNRLICILAKTMSKEEEA